MNHLLGLQRFGWDVVGERHSHVDREGAIKHKYHGILVSPRKQDCHGKASQTWTGQMTVIYQANVQKPLTI